MSKTYRIPLDLYETATGNVDCRCVLTRNTKGVVHFAYCPLHHAAPDLLAALEDINKRLSHAIQAAADQGRLELADMLEHIREPARATIAQAKGGDAPKGGS